ncbi:MAG: hypothetical protein K2L84_07740 [Muribaculaceae bacterium]|nr:hypothetical protein [Muribaculaceae bacterium]
MASKRKKRNTAKLNAEPDVQQAEEVRSETYLSRHNGNYIAAAMDYIDHCGLPGWCRSILRWTFMALIAAIILGGLFWPFF